MKESWTLKTNFFIFCLGITLCEGSRGPYVPIDLSPFSDVIKHWNDRTTGQGDLHYRPDQIVEIGDNLIAYQRSNGGWPTNVNPIRIVPADEMTQVLDAKASLDTSFDNRNTYPQIEYLAQVYQQTRLPRFRQAALQGIGYVLDSQYENGGWAHSPPSDQGYRAHVTFMDEVMPGVLRFLRKVQVGQSPFDFVEDSIRQRAVTAIAKGDQLILDLQVRGNGVPTAWAGQYDRVTLQPVQARSYELPGLVSWESVAVVRYLMSIEQPSDEVVAAIEHAVAWLESAATHGIRVDKVPVEPIKFKYYTSTYDLKVVPDEQAPRIWARFYDLKTNQPFFARRDGQKVGSLSEVDRERRTGYDWYGTWPEELLQTEMFAWRQVLGKD